MHVSPDHCYDALRTHDARFDGVFFVGVTTTGIYCRPVCPARLPARAHCTFFGSCAEAEHAGFRACFRCRPELAPGDASVDKASQLTRRAAAQIHSGYLNEHSLEALARTLGVTSRHLRRVMARELGVSPVELADTRRLALAKQLIQDTRLPLAEIAFASGFGSVRRFNTAFKNRFAMPPSALRRQGCAEAETAAFAAAEAITLRLDFRPPLAWPELLAFLRARAVPGVERVDDVSYQRCVSIGKCVGKVSLRAHPTRPALLAEVSSSLLPKLMSVRERLRAMFDLDAHPDAIARHLERDPTLGPLVRATPGLRVPGAFDRFELAVRAVLGQQVSVKAATTLAARLATTFGEPVSLGIAGLTHRFPRAEALARKTTADLRGIGLPEARAKTLLLLARAVARGRLDLDGFDSPIEAMAALQALPGIGPWTASYVAMRALHYPDAFLASDLAVKSALGASTAAAATGRAKAWQPWRAYAVLYLWQTHTKDSQ